MFTNFHERGFDFISFAFVRVVSWMDFYFRHLLSANKREMPRKKRVDFACVFHKNSCNSWIGDLDDKLGRIL